MEKITLNNVRSAISRYGIIIGTALLLFSWIFEKYQTANWDQKSSEISELRSHAFQELLLAQSNSLFLTRKAEIVPFQPYIETNEDIVNTLNSYKEVFLVLRKRLADVYHADIDEVIALIDQFHKIYSEDLEISGVEYLSDEEFNLNNELISQIQGLIKVGEGALATEVFYEAGLSRLSTIQSLSRYMNRSHYESRFEKVFTNMRSYADSLKRGRQPGTDVTSMIDTLYMLTNDVIQDLHTYSTTVNKMRYRYTNLYRVLYMLGSTFILLAMTLKRD